MESVVGWSKELGPELAKESSQKLAEALEGVDIDRVVPKEQHFWLEGW